MPPFRHGSTALRSWPPTRGCRAPVLGRPGCAAAMLGAALVPRPAAGACGRPTKSPVYTVTELSPASESIGVARDTGIVVSGTASPPAGGPGTFAEVAMIDIESTDPAEVAVLAPDELSAFTGSGVSVELSADEQVAADQVDAAIADAGRPNRGPVWSCALGTSAPSSPPRLACAAAGHAPRATALARRPRAHDPHPQALRGASSNCMGSGPINSSLRPLRPLRTTRAGVIFAGLEPAARVLHRRSC